MSYSYVCLEDDRVVSILEYEPNVPDSIKVVKITKREHEDIFSLTHFFNPETNSVEKIVLTQEQLDAQAASSNRSLRDSKLSNEVDPLVTNPLRWADLSQENKDAVAIYRRALLDITTHVNWPNLKPEDWPTLTLV